uniref:EGF-like domain-containing protein n=1 Tax=Strongyloides papillosus TaxID=174720 RepID=A0A0N5C0V4_STREA
MFCHITLLILPFILSIGSLEDSNFNLIFNILHYGSNFDGLGDEIKTSDRNYNLSLSEFTDINITTNNMDRIKVEKKKVYHIKYDKVSLPLSTNETLYGFTMDFSNKSSLKLLGRLSNFDIKHNESDNNITCQWHKCNVGIYFFHHDDVDKFDINNRSKEFNIDYLILFVIVPNDNKLYLDTVFYYGEVFLYHGCPVYNYIENNVNIEYFVDEEILRNEVVLPKYNKSYIFLPIFPRRNGETFFKCGYIKQPNVSTIDIGFYLKESYKVVEKLTNNNFGYTVKQRCPQLKSEYFHSYEYLHNNSSGVYERQLRRIKDNNYISSGNRVYYFNMENFNYSELFELKKFKPQKPYSVCIEDYADIKDRFIPILEKLNDIKEDSKTGILYQIIKPSIFNKTFEPKCIKKFDDGNDRNIINYRLDVIRNSNTAFDNQSIKNLIFTVNSIETYGGYFCALTPEYKISNSSNFKKQITYFIPENGTIFTLPNSQIRNLAEFSPPFAGYLEDYTTLTKISFFNITKNNEKLLLYKLTINGSKNINEELSPYVKNVLVLCEYITKVGTKISIVQHFLKHNSLKHQNELLKSNLGTKNYTKMTNSSRNSEENQWENSYNWQNAIIIIVLVLIIMSILVFFIFLAIRKANSQHMKNTSVNRKVHNREKTYLELKALLNKNDIPNFIPIQ